MLEVGDEAGCEGGAIGRGAGVDLDVAHEVGGGEDGGIVADGDGAAVLAYRSVGVDGADDAESAAFGIGAAAERSRGWVRGGGSLGWRRWGNLGW